MEGDGPIEPLAVGRVVRRAMRIAARPVAFQWMVAHVVLVYVGLVCVTAALEPQHWPERGRLAWGLGWLATVALLTGTSSGGVAFAAWSEHLGKRVSLGDCARAIAARAGRVTWESLRAGGVSFVGLFCFVIGAVWVLGANCAVVPSCVCEQHLSAKEASDRGFKMLLGNQTPALVMYAVATLFVVAVTMGARTVGGAIYSWAGPGIVAQAGFALGGAAVMAGGCLYGLLGAAAFVELRGARPRGEEIARTFE